jgi:putative ABC transport system substrate-binding protein
VKRRAFIGLIGGAAAWPLAARAQDGERMRRISVLMDAAPGASRGEALLATFLQRLNELGWSDGRNARFHIRWGGDSGAQQYRRYATELTALAPDVILADTTKAVAALQQSTRTVPIVFVRTVDPVGAGFVESLGRPGGSTTGFVAFEYAIAAKWLELLKEIAPGVSRAAILRDPTIPSGIGQFAAIQAVAPMNIELSAVDQIEAGTIERVVAAFARRSNGGLVVTAAPFMTNHPDAIPALAGQYKLPAVYPFRYLVEAGGLISYGPDTLIQFRAAADYVDRILKGEKPADLPVQTPTKYELVVNMKTAKALGINMPDSVLARADEVIE